MSVDFGIGFGKAKQVGDEIHIVGRNQPHALVLFNSLAAVSFKVVLAVDGIYKGEYTVGEFTSDEPTGNDGSCAVSSVYITCDPEMEAHADDEKIVWFRDPTVTKRVEATFTPSVGEVLTKMVMVRFE